MKKILFVFMTFLIVFSFTACKKSQATSSVYLLNFKSELDAGFKELATLYEQQTGVKVKVVTSAEGRYEETLTAEMLKSDKPTIFTINGPISVNRWKDYTLELNKTKENGYEELKSLSNLLNNNLVSSVTLNNNVYGLPITVEGYGLVYNKKVFNEYFAQSNKTSNLTSVNQINNFSSLKTVVEDLTKYINKAKTCTTSCETILGLNGVFAPVTLNGGNDWAYHTHLSYIPFYFEFKEINDNNPFVAGLEANSISFKYNISMKNFFDLYINNNVISRDNFSQLDYKSAVDSFATQKSAIIQQGNWVYDEIVSIQARTIEDNSLGMMPIFTGLEGEDNYTIPIGTESFWAINKSTSKENINASIKFIDWMFTDLQAKNIVKEKLGFMAPFNTFNEGDLPTNPLTKEVFRLAGIPNKTNIPWNIDTYPNQEFNDVFGCDLLDYAKGNISWSEFVNDVKKEWEKHKTK